MSRREKAFSYCFVVWLLFDSHFTLFPVPLCGSRTSVSGYCSYFLIPLPVTLSWIFLVTFTCTYLFLFTLSHTMRYQGGGRRQSRRGNELVEDYTLKAAQEVRKT